MLASAVLLFAFLGLGPRTGVYKTLTVLTASMSPGIPAGAVVVAAPMRPVAVAVGDVLVYVPPGDSAVVSHRVVEVQPDPAGPLVQTQGDRNEQRDEVVQLVGEQAWTVRSVIPWLGYGIQALRHPVARLLTVWVCPLLFALVLLARIWRRSPEELEEEVERILERSPEPLPAPESPVEPLPAVVDSVQSSWYVSALAEGADGEVGAWYDAALAGADDPATGRRRGRRRLAATGTASVLLVVLLAVPAVAAFNDAESAATSLSTGSVAAPGSLTATRGCTPVPLNRYVDLTWTTPADAGGDPGYGYVVERATNAAGPWTTILTRDGRALLTYRDEALAGLTTYHYRVGSTYKGWTSLGMSPTASQTTHAAGCL